METNIILGPPGTGKTTFLLGVVRDELRHTSIERISYLAFTRRAAHEAITRAGYTRAQAPLFRTIHSLCFMLTGMSRSRMLGKEDRILFERMYGIYLGRPPANVPTFDEDGLGAMLLYLYDMARIRRLGLTGAYSRIPTEISYDQLEQFTRMYERHKRDHEVRDFTDLLVDYLEGHYIAPPIDALIVDEAQDLSPLQWNVVEKVCRQSRVKRLYVAGDDDQAIFQWAGADTETFLSLCGDRTVLRQSHRVPGSVHRLAEGVTRRIARRALKQWSPTNNHGSVEFYADVEDIDMSKNRWLILARDNYTLNAAAIYIREQGWLYSRNYEPALPPAAMPAIHAWERIRAGHPQAGDRAKVTPFQTMAARRRTRGPGGPPWYEALDKLSGDDAEYLRAARRHGERTDNVRIRISTIHSAKGAEEENVVLFTDISPRAQEQLETQPDDENRVLYVGITRTSNRLIVVEPRTRCSYNLW